MIQRSELYKTSEYWIDRIQNDIFRALFEYKEENNLTTNTALADNLGVSKGYISQIMNGNFNFSIGKLIDLALTINMVPDLELRSIQEFTAAEEVRLERMNKPTLSTLISLSSGNNFRLDAAIQDPLTVVG